MTDDKDHGEECCETCRFWRRMYKSGECRRQTPVYNISERESGWPTSRDCDWCGKYEAER